MKATPITPAGIPAKFPELSDYDQRLRDEAKRYEATIARVPPIRNTKREEIDQLRRKARERVRKRINDMNGASHHVRAHRDRLLAHFGMTLEQLAKCEYVPSPEILAGCIIHANQGDRTVDDVQVAWDADPSDLHLANVLARQYWNDANIISRSSLLAIYNAVHPEWDVAARLAEKETGVYVCKSQQPLGAAIKFGLSILRQDPTVPPSYLFACMAVPMRQVELIRKELWPQA